MTEILFNKKTKKYTLQEEINGEKTCKKVPIHYKPNDKTSRFRRDILKKEIENNKQ